jgi:hypothetical protein
MSNTQAFEKILLQGVELQNKLIQESLMNSEDHKLFPKLRKSSRSFKEVAETCIEQMQFLLTRGYIKAQSSESQRTLKSTGRDRSADNLNS